MNLYSYVVNDPVNYIDPWGLETLGEWDISFDPNSHGGEHFDVYNKHGRNIGRFRANDWSPIEHKGKVPKLPGKLRKLLKKAGYIVLAISVTLDLMAGESLAEALTNGIDPFAADRLGNDSDDNDNGIPDDIEEELKEDIDGYNIPLLEEDLENVKACEN